MTMKHRSILAVLSLLLPFLIVAQHGGTERTKVDIVNWERSPHVPGDTIGIQLLNDLVVSYLMRGQVDSALRVSAKALALGEQVLTEVQGTPQEMRFRENYANTLDLGIDILLNTGDPVGGVARARQALDNAEFIKDTKAMGRAYAHLSHGFHKLGFDSLALAYHHQFMRYMDNSNTTSIVYAMIEHGTLLNACGASDSAIVILNDALVLNDPWVSSYNHMNICYALASIYLRRNQIEQAEIYAAIARKLLHEVPGSTAFPYWDLIEAQLDLLHNDPQDALIRTILMDSIGRAKGDPEQSGAALRLKTIAYGMLGRPADALQSSDSMLLNLRNEFSEEKVRKLAWTQAEMAHQRELEQQAAEIRERKQGRDMAMAGLGAAVLVAFLLAGLVVQAKRGATRLRAANLELSTTQERLVMVEHERAAEAVRTRIALDIHDDVGGELTRLAMISEALNADQDSDRPQVTMLDDLADSARRISALMSDVVWAAEPGADTAKDVVERVKITSARLIERSSILLQTDFRVTHPELKLHPEVKRDIQLLVKEALNNAVKYSQAQNISIVLHLGAEQFSFRISDDGIGYKGPREGGHGQRNMQIRAARLGGELRIDTPPGGGMVIEVNGTFTRSLG